MPIIHIGRDPVLISIDRQRLNDLGIPAEPGHESVSVLYGVLGVVRPVLIVPEDWEYALPQEWPPPEEWNHEEWERAGNDSTNELPAHSRPVPLMARMQAAAVAMLVICAFILSLSLIGMIAHALFARPEGRLGSDPAAGVAVFAGLVLAAAAIAVLSPILGCLSAVAGRVLRHPCGVPVVALLVLFFQYSPILAVIALPLLRPRD